MYRSSFIAFLTIVLTGCQSHDVNHYTAPEVTGRVLAADTHQPLANVRVWRGNGNSSSEPFGPPKGGQLLIQPGPVMTDAGGRFQLDSQSTFALFRSPGWWTEQVTFQRSGYESFQTNYTGTNVTSHTPAGAPVVNAGDILLRPVAK